MGAVAVQVRIDHCISQAKDSDVRQYAKAVGASPIVAVAGKKNEELVKSLGATHFVDYVSAKNEPLRTVIDKHLVVPSRRRVHCKSAICGTRSKESP